MTARSKSLIVYAIWLTVLGAFLGYVASFFGGVVTYLA